MAKAGIDGAACPAFRYRSMRATARCADYLLHTASRLDARMIDHLFWPLVITL
jgi:hypothetical protein